MALTIRQANLSDVSAIVALVNRAYRGETGRMGWTTESHLLDGIRTDEERVRSAVTASDSTILCAFNGADLVGCVHLEKREPATGYLGMLTVEPLQQAHGCGRAIVKAAEDFVRETWDCKVMEMTVITIRTELIAWYERRGYRKTNERRPFPADERFGIQLQGPLEFVVLTKSL